MSADRSEEQRKTVGRPFKKGESGNPAGSKPRDPELQALAKEYSVPALRKIIDIMDHPHTEPETVLRAAKLVIERGYGKAPQKIEVEHYDVMTEHELRAQLDEHLAVIQLMASLKATAAIRRTLDRKHDRTRLERYRPYAKQREFHAAGLTYRERLLMASNRFGKTECGAAEMAMHLTGEYPDWWTGKRFEKPIRAWAAGVTNQSTRDVVQAKLIGPPTTRERWGTGYIPGAALGEPTLSRGTPDLIDTVAVHHVTKGLSYLQFKSYEQGREKWQGAGLEAVWFDEEPDQDIYTEGLTRTNETGGITYLTFTPLLGMSKVVRRFLTGD